MLDISRWKVWGISLVCLVCVLLAVPSLFPESQVKRWAPWVPSARINLGLDLAGGSSLLLEAETKDVAKQVVARMEETMRTEMRRASPRIETGEMSTSGGQLSFMVRDPARVEAAMEIARNQTQPAGVAQRDWKVDLLDGSRIVMAPTEAGLNRSLDDAMDTAREVVCRRVDPTGATEASCLRKGQRRIEIQVPGLQDPERLKSLIGKTARLEFKLVNEEVSPDMLRRGQAPPGSQVLPYPEDPRGVGAIAVFRRVMVNGDQVNNARQDFDPNGQPAVSITFNTQGAKKFGTATQQNVNKPFAIILDDVVISAPNINEPILGGNAQIAGSFTVEKANDLAVQLRSGRLPIDLAIIQESSVGSELGADSIHWGVIASVAAVGAVILFMLVTYGRFGVYATIGLILNALMILGIMAVFNATLTLPGIAGFVLTIGAAVDANVLINERIREELRRGRKILDAIESGYREASTAIFDANITNVIAAMIMFIFGSGPISGFAVVLMIGIVTSVFTAVNVTRMFVALWVRRARPRTLHI